MSDTINYPLSAAIELCDQLDKETPEADKAERMAYSQEYMVDTEVARKLERERNEARQKYNNLATEHMLEINKICNERDDLMAQDYRTEARAMRYCQERDEAREALNSQELVITQHKVITELIIERDEARVQQVSACNSTLRLDAINFKLKKELDDAKQKIKSQTDRLRILEGATNHASGTPLKIALRERDEAVEDQKNSRQSLAFALEELEEARNEIHGWKNKWECAVDMAARAEIDRDDILNKLKYIMDILK